MNQVPGNDVEKDALHPDSIPIPYKTEVRVVWREENPLLSGVSS